MKKASNDLIAFSDSDEMNKWASEIWELIKTLNIEQEQVEALNNKVKFISDKFTPVGLVCV